MGVNSSHLLPEEEIPTQSQSRILTNHQFSTMDWVVARKTDSPLTGSKLTFHKRLGADVLPDEDLIRQMSQELTSPTHRYWTKQTIHSLFRICLDGTRKMDCRYLSIVLLSNYILRANNNSASHPIQDMYEKEDLEGFYDSMIESVTCHYTVGNRPPNSPIQTDIQYKTDAKEED